MTRKPAITKPNRPRLRRRGPAAGRPPDGIFQGWGVKF